MKLVLLARNYAAIADAEEVLRNSPHLKILDEYKNIFTMSMDTGAVSEVLNYFPVFGFKNGGRLKVFPYKPGECCIEIEGSKEDIEFVADLLKLPGRYFDELCKLSDL